VIAHAVWLYFRFHLSFRDVEELLAERGIIVSYEAIRHWCYTFGPGYAADLRRRRAQPGDKWHLDEVLLKIAGKRHWLWRAVHQNGDRPGHPRSGATGSGRGRALLTTGAGQLRIRAACGHHRQAYELRAGHQARYRTASIGATSG